MKNLLLKDIFDEICQHVTFDQKIVKKISNFRLAFVTRNEDHIRFFGGNLLGVDVVRFTPNDRREFFDIFDVDETVVAKKIKGTTPDFNVLGDPLNNFMAYLLHRFFNEKKLNEKLRKGAMMDVALLWNYKFFTSRLANTFRYPADKEIAEATYMSLSKKYLIKRYGTWNEVFRIRCEDMFELHKKAIESMQDNDDVHYLIVDTHSRIRSIFVNIATVHFQMAEQKVRVKSSVSTMLDKEGEIVLKDKENSLQKYTRYLTQIAGSKAEFVKPEIMDVIEKLMPTMPPRLFEKTLDYIAEHYSRANNDKLRETLNKILVHAFDYIFRDKSGVRSVSDIPTILGKLKGTYSSSRNNEELMIEIRKEVEDIVRKATKVNHVGHVNATRTGILLYVVCRSITMRYYSN